MATPRQNQWFLPGAGIAREVITADIQRYLGPNALVRPGVGTGEHAGEQGYWITAYRTLTSNMIEDLKLDSQRWQQERQPSSAGRGSAGSRSPHVKDKKQSRGPDASLVSYVSSQTHAARQNNGPTTPYDPHQQAGFESRSSSTTSRQTYAPGYAGSDPHYVTTSSPSYAASPYQQAPAAAQPRTTPVDPYAAYREHQPAGRGDARGYQQPAQYTYPQAPVDMYGRPTQPTSQYAAQSPVNPNDYYTASDGRQYLRSQQPQAQPAPNPPSGSTRDSRYR